MYRRPDTDALSVTVGIATTGRSGVTTQTLDHMAGLRDRPDRVILSVAEHADHDPDAVADPPFPVDVVVGPRGSSVQRNAILDTAQDADIILFLDDDFLISDGYIAALRRLFLRHPDVVVATGHVVADGVRGPGFDHAEGRRLLSSATPPAVTPAPRDVYSGYGCNLAVRGATIRQAGDRFDADLPLYAWLEDLDFSRRLAAFGRVVQDDSMTGVHLATKIGRSSGRRLGYSQIANPVHLVRKGTFERRRALKLMAGNLLANGTRAIRPEPWIDRAGRLSGNLLALRDLALGRLSPCRVLDL